MYDDKECFNQAFGRRCRLARGDRRAEDVAEQAGIPPQFLSSVERGKKAMTGMNIANLARALHVTTDYLLYGRTDADGTWAAVAEHLTALTPATRDLAGELLKTMLDMLEAARPD